MREDGLEKAIAAIGGVSALSRALGVSQPTVSNWRRIPSERVLAAEAATGVPRGDLRPDLYPSAPATEAVDEIDLARAAEYRLIAALFARAPKADLLERVARVRGDASPLGMAHLALAQAAEAADPDRVDREYFDLFIGVGRGEFLPYGSYYQAGFLNDRPLARLRADLAALGIEKADPIGDPEDHIAGLCEAMAGLVDGTFPAKTEDQQAIFERHLKPWAGRFFADVAASERADFYRAAARVGGLFIEIETQAFALEH
ncbi:MAG: molecular chaperone TorD family protein [Rhizobiales bacterium]|nr:molecular chaperone TorD family protein [Hyphomicrobiales bacterium]